ncbi:MAG: Gfo/Idh/MocA family oxidoreductase [Acidobacteria bacterium]|nr:Gfo/Idh/MocA family oxidoreductase [Acidobacteriota bacterium]
MTETSGLSSTSRRAFLSGATALSASRVLGANNRIRLGIIGTGGRGSYLMGVANRTSQVEWVALSDAWDVRRSRAKELAGQVPDYADYRALLDRKDIDAVIVATWDNMHSTATIDACRAGKDVYVEKPMTSEPMQGVDVVRAVRETGRIVQVGMQQRSMEHFIEAKQRFFDSGLIGPVHMVRTVWNGNSGYTFPVPAGMETKPAGLDWNACLGPLPKIPWDPKRFFNRFAYWDLSSGGQTGGLFVHWVDVVHWYLGLHQATAAVALGGIYQYPDGRDTPDNINAVVEYPKGLTVTFEATLTDETRGGSDIVFMGTGGRLHITRGGYRFLPGKRSSKTDEILGQRSSEESHMANWLDCVRTRKNPNAGVVEGHYSSLACHIVNNAYRSGTRAVWRKEWDV